MYWDEVIKMKTNENIKYDGWLDKYLLGKVSEKRFLKSLIWKK